MGSEHRRDEQAERYEIRRRIGSGGVGVVYEAFDTRLERLVALKRLLPPEESEDVGGIGRDLKREAAALAALQHPNIVTVLDFGSDDEGFFIVMELLVGETVDVTVARGALTVADFGRFAEQVLDALAAAHERHLLHRDLKPSNVFIVWSAPDRFQVKLLDFGLAKFAVRPALQTVDHRQSILGSVYFMAPEQFERKPLDVRTDLYQLGCLFFHVLTNRHAFEGETTAAVMEAHLSGAPRDLGRLRPDLPDSLRRWVLWHLNREAGDRPVSASASLTALREVAEGRPPAGMRLPTVAGSGSRVEARTATVPVRPRTAVIPRVAPAPPAPASRSGGGKANSTPPARPMATPGSPAGRGATSMVPAPPPRPPAPVAAAKPGGHGAGRSHARVRGGVGPPMNPPLAEGVGRGGERRGPPVWAWVLIVGLGLAAAAAAVAVAIGLPGRNDPGSGGGIGAVPAVPPFPSDLEPHLVARFDSTRGVFRDAGATPADDGDTAAHWLDQSPAYGFSPAQYHVTQATDPASRWPLWWRDAMFDPPRPVLVFDGSKHLLIGRKGAGDPIDEAFADGRFSIVVACRPGEGSRRQDIFGAGNAGKRSPAFAAFVRDGAWHLAVERDAKPSDRTASVAVAPDGDWLQVVEFRVGDRVDGLAVHRWRPDGEEVLGEALPMPDPPPPTPNEIRLGARFQGGAGGNDRFRGVIAEFLLFDRPLTEDERRRVAAHLVAKLGLAPPSPR